MCDSEESDEELPVGLTPIKCGKLESKTAPDEIKIPYLFGYKMGFSSV